MRTLARVETANAVFETLKALANTRLERITNLHLADELNRRCGTRFVRDDFASWRLGRNAALDAVVRAYLGDTVFDSVDSRAELVEIFTHALLGTEPASGMIGERSWAEIESMLARPSLYERETETAARGTRHLVGALALHNRSKGTRPKITSYETLDPANGLYPGYMAFFKTVSLTEDEADEFVAGEHAESVALERVYERNPGFREFVKFAIDLKTGLTSDNKKTVRFVKHTFPTSSIIEFAKGTRRGANLMSEPFRRVKIRDLQQEIRAEREFRAEFEAALEKARRPERARALRADIRACDVAIERCLEQIEALRSISVTPRVETRVDPVPGKTAKPSSDRAARPTTREARRVIERPVETVPLDSVQPIGPGIWSLSDVRVNHRASEDALAFSATVNRHGVPVFSVSNNGRGDNQYRPAGHVRGVDATRFVLREFADAAQREYPRVDRKSAVEFYLEELVMRATGATPSEIREFRQTSLEGERE